MNSRYCARYKLAAAFLIIGLLVAGCGANKSSVNENHDSDALKTKTMSWSKMPDMFIDLSKSYTAKFRTSKGSFTVKLYAKEAPVTVNNFVFLAEEKFYEGLTFHTVIESFMIQTGDPNGNGTGSPGYIIPDELDTGLKFEEGIVAMANASGPNTGGSQFFICTGPDAVNLNRQPNYSIFGKVIDGMDTVRAIAQTPTKGSKPLEDVIIESIQIEAL